MKHPPYFFDAPQEFHPERLFALERIGNPSGKVILDVGCGAHKTIESAIGVDVRPGADHQASMDFMPFAGRSVDFIISRHSLEHALDTIAVLREWHRVLKCGNGKGGRVILVLPDHEAINTMDPFYSSGEHLHAFTQQSLTNLIKDTEYFWLEWLGAVVPDWSFGAVLERL